MTRNSKTVLSVLSFITCVDFGGTLVQFKDSMFKLLRNDTDIVMISNKYVEELRALPDERISATAAVVKVGIPVIFNLSNRKTHHAI